LPSLAALAAPLLFFAACGGNVVVTGGGEGGDGGAGGTPTVTEDCPPGLTDCKGACVDLTKDPQNCGKCGNSCQGDACQGGQCVISPGCPPNLTKCNGTCVNTSTDPKNCGGCNAPCPPGTACSGGFCQGGCICGAICNYTDLGAKIPQSVSLSVSSLTDSYKTDCGPGGAWPDIAFLFTAPFTGTFTFDTFGSVDTVLEILSPECSLYACSDDASPDGTSAATLELGAGQTVVVFVDAIAGSGPLTLHIDQGKECAKCSDYISGQSFELPLCNSSEFLYDTLVTCICQGACGMACASACNGGDFLPECEQCIYDQVNGCGKPLDACFNDF
jgi:hypothetical protein